MEEITHAVNKNHLGLGPPKGQGELIGMKRYAKAILIATNSHFLETQGQALCVAVLAPRTDLCAASDRIPSGVGPLDS